MIFKSILHNLTRRVSPAVEKGARAIPAVNRRIEAQYDDLMAGLEPSLKPYRDGLVSRAHLPEAGLERAAILHEMSELRDRRQARWRDLRLRGRLSWRRRPRRLPESGLRPHLADQPATCRRLAEHRQV